jgi:hypothetical protein
MKNGVLNMDPDKRRMRQLKKAIKRAGNKSRRQSLKRDLVEKPDEAHRSEYDFGPGSSTGLNALDRDATRRRRDEKK